MSDFENDLAAIFSPTAPSIEPPEVGHPKLPQERSIELNNMRHNWDMMSRDEKVSMILQYRGIEDSHQDIENYFKKETENETRKLLYDMELIVKCLCRTHLYSHYKTTMINGAQLKKTGGRKETNELSYKLRIKQSMITLGVFISTKEDEKIKGTTHCKESGILEDKWVWLNGIAKETRVITEDLIQTEVRQHVRYHQLDELKLFCLKFLAGVKYFDRFLYKDYERYDCEKSKHFIQLKNETE